VLLIGQLARFKFYGLSVDRNLRHTLL
jgi:hypothetical protein